MVNRERILLAEGHIRTPRRHKHTVHGSVVENGGGQKRGGRPLKAFDNRLKAGADRAFWLELV